MGVLALRVLDTCATPQEKSQILTFDTPTFGGTPNSIMADKAPSNPPSVPPSIAPVLLPDMLKRYSRKKCYKEEGQKNPRGKIEIF